MEPLWGECNSMIYNIKPQFQELGIEEKVSVRMNYLNISEFLPHRNVLSNPENLKGANSLLLAC